jgi:hypothetical protein
VSTRDSRYNFLDSGKEYSFVDYTEGAVWYGNPYYYTRNETLDGTLYQEQSKQKLFGCYFFLSTDRVEHARDAQNFFNILSEFGGLLEILIGSLGIFKVVNKKLKIAKQIRSLYVVKKKKKGQPEPIKFSLSEKLSDLYGRCCKNKTKQAKLYARGRRRVNKCKNFSPRLMCFSSMTNKLFPKSRSTTSAITPSTFALTVRQSKTPRISTSLPIKTSKSSSVRRTTA